MKRIGEILIAKGYITKDDLEKALSEQGETREKIGEIFLKKRIITDDDLANVLSEQLKIPVADVHPEKISQNLLSLFVQSYMRKNRFLPLEISGRKLVIATDNPVNSELISEAAFITGMDILVSVARTAEMDRAFNELFGRENLFVEMNDDFLETSAVSAKMKREDEEKSTKPVVRLVNAVILDAIKLRASDIHFEPQENTLIVRYRIDGFLHEHLRIPKSAERMVISRIKIMARMDITQSRKPQDGNIQLYVAKKDISLRVSTLPIMNGEKIVIRILDKSKIMISMESLGLSEEHIRIIRRNMEKSQGIILVTGPTGSGKTTTLYSVLQELDYGHKNVSTIEDPIEYTIKGINQTQIDTKSGMTFAAALRTLLRQDPNVVLVGEIRDTETASTAFKAAMTGHLIFSTLHTNDEISTIVRLRDLDIAPYLISDGLLLIIAQRLVRKVCRECATERDADDEERLFLGLERGGKIQAANPKGCESCGFTGYRGVIGIYGVLETNQKIKEMIEKSAHVNVMNDYLERQGYRSIMADGVGKVLSGVTTADELKRVLDIGRFEGERRNRESAKSEREGEAKILIVDDVKTVRVMLKALLESEGFSVAEAENGRDAFRILKEGGCSLLVTDVSMPEMNGFQLLDAVREDEKLRGMPVIMLTSQSESESEVKGLKSGADDYISKPIDPERVILRVKNLLKRSGAQNGVNS